MTTVCRTQATNSSATSRSTAAKKRLRFPRCLTLSTTSLILQVKGPPNLNRIAKTSCLRRNENEGRFSDLALRPTSRQRKIRIMHSNYARDSTKCTRRACSASPNARPNAQQKNLRESDARYPLRTCRRRRGVRAHRHPHRALPASLRSSRRKGLKSVLNIEKRIYR